MPKQANATKSAVRNQPGKNTGDGGQSAGLAAKLDRLLSRIPKGSFATVGGRVGGPIGAALGKGLSSITGYGDYVVSSNSLMGKTVVGEMADQVPIFRNQGADTRVKHCEFVRDLVVPSSGTGYSVTSLPIDPVSSDTFPWLSKVARKYQRYKVKGMVIGYRSTSTDYNNSGVVAIVVNYDPAENAYASMEGLLNSKFAVSTKPSNSMLAPVECDPGRSPMDGYYVKHVTSDDVTDATLRQTRMGTINIATQGLTLPAGSTIGQIYVSYDIELMYPYMTTVPSVQASGCIGPTVYGTQSAIDSFCQDNGFGDLVGYGNLTVPTRQIALVSVGAPTAATGSWFRLIFPPGKYKVTVLDSSWHRTSAGDYLTGGTMRASYGGSSVVTTRAGDTSNLVDCSAMVGTIITVTDGDEADRSYTPVQMMGRTLSGNSTYANLAIIIENID